MSIKSLKILGLLIFMNLSFVKPVSGKSNFLDGIPIILGVCGSSFLCTKFFQHTNFIKKLAKRFGLSVQDTIDILPYGLGILWVVAQKPQKKVFAPIMICVIRGLLANKDMCDQLSTKVDSFFGCHNNQCTGMCEKCHAKKTAFTCVSVLGCSVMLHDLYKKIATQRSNAPVPEEENSEFMHESYASYESSDNVHEEFSSSHSFPEDGQLGACNICFEEKKRVFSPGACKCVFKMCESCKVKWWNENGACPLCREPMA